MSERLAVGQDTVLEFLDSSRYSTLASRLRSHLPLPASSSESTVVGNFIGGVFEGLTFHALGKFPKLGQTLLNPQQSAEYYQRVVHPNRKMVSEEFATRLSGLATPDGVLIGNEDNKPTILYDYSIRRDIEGFERKYNGLSRDIRLYPDLFYQTRIVFVIPRDPELARALERMDVDRHASVLEMPFSRGDFSELFSDLLDKVIR